MPQARTTLAAGALGLAAAMTLHAQPAPAGPPQVIVPEVERREVPLPRLPASNDFFATLFAGSYATQNFGSSAVAGLRLGYHVTEDVFVEATLGRSSVSDAAFRQVLPGGVFVQGRQPLTYFSAAAGLNVFSGEAFFGRTRAKALQGYLLGGIGSTRLAAERHQTFSVGAGLRFIVNDHVALQADAREHLFALDLLGARQNTRNPEFTLGVAARF